MNAMTWLFLALAIVFEVIATSALKSAEGFTRWIPSIIVVVGYAGAFYFLSQALKLNMPVGIAYAIWSGLGTTLIVLIGIFVYRESLNWMTALGLVLIVGGVIILNIFAKGH